MAKIISFDIIDGRKYKKCIVGQIRNPITKRCNKIKEPKPKKECPEGKVLNPITKRCNKIKEPKTQKTTQEKDFCLSVNTIPQFGGTCWFNSILMASLYSQLSRKLLLKLSVTWDKKNNFLMVLRNILIKHYFNSKKTIEYFNKVKPEAILFKMLITYENKGRLKQNLKKNIKENGNYSKLGWINSYISIFYKYLGVKCLEITYLKQTNTFLVNAESYVDKTKDNVKDKIENDEIRRIKLNNKRILKDIPDIIVLNHSDLNIQYTNLMKAVHAIYRLSNPVFAKVHELSSYNITPSASLEKYDEIIEFNGHKYKLDSCLISNYDLDNKLQNHSIVGLTCKNNKYVYNGWNKNTTDNAAGNLNDVASNACSLIPFDWDVKKNSEFCLNTKLCKLDVLNPNEQRKLCFSFNKGSRVLVYIRIKDNDKSSIFIRDSTKSMSISNLSSLINEMHDIDKLTKAELIEIFKRYGMKETELTILSEKTLKQLLRKVLKSYFNK